jgi:hypothetical protein
MGPRRPRVIGADEESVNAMAAMWMTAV